MTVLYIGDRVQVIDRYPARAPGGERSWFHGMRGRVTKTQPYVMVHLEGERLPLAFDERDLVREESSHHMTAGD